MKIRKMKRIAHCMISDKRPYDVWQRSLRKHEIKLHSEAYYSDVLGALHPERMKAILSYIWKNQKKLFEAYKIKYERCADWIKKHGYTDQASFEKSVEWQILRWSKVTDDVQERKDYVTRSMQDVIIRTTNFLQRKDCDPIKAYSAAKRLVNFAHESYFLDLSVDYFKWYLDGNDKSVTEFMMTSEKWSKYFDSNEKDLAISEIRPSN